MPWTLTVRDGPQVRRERFDAPGPALDALEAEVDALAADAHSGTRRALGREYAPAEQVVARAEIRGPNRLAPTVRGDGSIEAWTGWVRRTLVEPRDGERPVQALRTALGA